MGNIGHSLAGLAMADRGNSFISRPISYFYKNALENQTESNDGDYMEIIKYQDKYKQQIIDLILHIQNCEAKINLTIKEQPDLLDVPLYYEKNGGVFWIAAEKTR